ncbi:MAG: hypothetical protein ORN27_10365 [Rhodoluna sp.]|nr:hypothetical protein [Rhodoluna sp.]
MKNKVAIAIFVTVAALVGASGISTANAVIPSPSATPTPTNTLYAPYQYDPADDCGSYDLEAHQLQASYVDSQGVTKRAFNSMLSTCYQAYFLRLNSYQPYEVDIAQGAPASISKAKQSVMDRLWMAFMTKYIAPNFAADGWTMIPNPNRSKFPADFVLKRDDISGKFDVLTLRTISGLDLTALKKVLVKTEVAKLISMPGDADFCMDGRVTSRIAELTGGDANTPIQECLYKNAKPFAPLTFSVTSYVVAMGDPVVHTVINRPKGVKVTK